MSQTPGDPEQTTATRRLSHRHTHLAAHTTLTLRRKGPPFRAEMGCFCVCSAQVQEVAKNSLRGVPESVVMSYSYFVELPRLEDIEPG
ncbi:hypothetical protein Mt3935_18580, partial [Mycobacterium tuberculosis]